MSQEDGRVVYESVSFSQDRCGQWRNQELGVIAKAPPVTIRELSPIMLLPTKMVSKNEEEMAEEKNRAPPMKLEANSPNNAFPRTSVDCM